MQNDTKIKQLLGAQELEKYLKLFMIKRELGLKQSGFSNPLLILGESGIGKSQIVEAFAKKEKMFFVKFDLSNVDSTTFNGLMITTNNGDDITHYHTIPSFIKRLKTEAQKGSKALIFLDEINRSSYETRNAVFKLVINNEWGVDSTKLSENIFVVAAMNPNNSDYGDTEDLDTALKKRFISIEYVPDVKDWLRYAKKAKIHPNVTKILNFNRDLFVYNDPENKTGLDPRSWEDLSYALYAADELYPKDLKVTYNILEMYAPYFHKKLRFYFQDSNNQLSIEEIETTMRDKGRLSEIPLHIKTLYKKTSAPRKIELLKDALEYYMEDSLSEIGFTTILKLSSEEHLLSVYNPLLSNVSNSEKAKKAVELTRKIDEKYRLKLFDNLLEVF